MIVLSNKAPSRQAEPMMTLLSPENQSRSFDLGLSGFFQDTATSSIVSLHRPRVRATLSSEDEARWGIHLRI